MILNMFDRRKALAAVATALPFAAGNAAKADQSIRKACIPPDSGDDYRFVARLLGTEKLLWPPALQREGYKHLEKILAVRHARRGTFVSKLPAYDRNIGDMEFEDRGAKIGLKDFMRLESVAGLLVLKEGRVALERYALGFTENDHWTSMSMVKSITSTLVGCALHDGAFPNLDVKVGEHIPELVDSAYSDVSLKQLLRMSSGVQWNENYKDPKSDVNLYYEAVIAARDAGGIFRHLKTLKRIYPPGTQFHYNSAETFVIGTMVTRATGKYLADYLSEKIWSRMGAEQDIMYILESDNGQDIGGSSANASLRDYGRFGLFILANGNVGGRQVLPPGWIAEATKPSAPNFGIRPGGYGYQWWVKPGGFAAVGFAGQLLYINPSEKLIVVILSARPSKNYANYVAGEASATRRPNFLKAVTDKLHTV